MTLWEYFLFEPKEKKHKAYAPLTDLWNPKFDKKNKKIITFSPGGHASAIFISDTYVWKNGNIKLIESTKQDWNREKNLYVNIVLKRTSGEMRIDRILLLDVNEAKQESFKYAE